MQNHSIEPCALKVTCDTKLRIPLDQLNGIQGNLKAMTAEARVKLRKLLLRYGINFSLHVWKEEQGLSGKIVTRWWIIDGHGRVSELKAMREDGYTIPDLPCVEIEANSLADARERVLAATSQFQKINPAGLFEFLEQIEMSPDILGDYDIPDFSIPEFRAEFYDDHAAEPKRSVEGSQELERKSFTTFKQSCPKCGFSFDDNKKEIAP